MRTQELSPIVRILIDTNILIPAEPTSGHDVSVNTPLAAAMLGLAAKVGAEIWIHPAQRIDLAQDAATERRLTRDLLLLKYRELAIPVGDPPKTKTNDWVDDQLIQALANNAVGLLVSEDKALHRRAASLGYAERVLTLPEAVSTLKTFAPGTVSPPPSVEATLAYNLKFADPLWRSFESDYPEFDRWFAKCQREHRPAWVIRDPGSSQVIGAAIVNEERKEPRGNRTLKICSFKIDDAHSGKRLGELLMKAILMYANERRYDSLFVTAFETHEPLIALLRDLGFAEEPDRRSSGELAFTKVLEEVLPNAATPNPLQFFLEYGPFVLDLIGPKIYVVPILPAYHRMLFPEMQAQTPLIPDASAFGNALRKVYISQSSINPPNPGDVLLFYRSQDERSVTAWGVVERCLRSQNTVDICSFVLPRTVYTREEIEEKCIQGPVLAIMFRQCLRTISPPIRFSELTRAGIIAAAPQSIVVAKGDAGKWILARCQTQR